MKILNTWNTLADTVFVQHSRATAFGILAIVAVLLATALSSAAQYNCAGQPDACVWYLTPTVR